VAYFTDQVTSDTTSPMAPINGGRFADFAIGGLLGYDFGPAAANVVVTDEVYAKTMGGSPGVGNTFTEQGFKVFGELSYKLYDLGEAPDTSKRPMVYK